jgi:hypothetical protein
MDRRDSRFVAEIREYLSLKKIRQMLRTDKGLAPLATRTTQSVAWPIVLQLETKQTSVWSHDVCKQR